MKPQVILSSGTMMQRKAAALLLIALALCGCSGTEMKMRGDWVMGDVTYNFKNGAMIIKDAGFVFGTYEFIDTNTIRFRSDMGSNPLDLIVIIEFPSQNIMQWYIKTGSTPQRFFRFQK